MPPLKEVSIFMTFIYLVVKLKKNVNYEKSNGMKKEVMHHNHILIIIIIINKFTARAKHPSAK